MRHPKFVLTFIQYKCRTTLLTFLLKNGFWVVISSLNRVNTISHIYLKGKCLPDLRKDLLGLIISHNYKCYNYKCLNVLSFCTTKIVINNCKIKRFFLIQLNAFFFNFCSMRTILTKKTKDFSVIFLFISFVYTPLK